MSIRIGVLITIAMAVAVGLFLNARERAALAQGQLAVDKDLSQGRAALLE
jgi:hypothetical protein